MTILQATKMGPISQLSLALHIRQEDPLPETMELSGSGEMQDGHGMGAESSYSWHVP
jgi:hypothetical protein